MPSRTISLPYGKVRRRLSPYLDRAQRRAGQSDLAVRAMSMVRNQCERVIAYGTTNGSDPATNGELWFLRAFAPTTHLFIDVGANVGDWTAALLQANPAARGILVEPSESALAVLADRFDPRRIELLAAAVADEPGRATFWQEPDAGETSSLVPAEGNARGSQREVPVTTIDGIVQQRGLRSVDFLKVDAEGFDARVLEGARESLASHCIRRVQFEYNRSWALAGRTLGGALRLLEDSGYEVFALSGTGLRALRYEIVGEFFGYANLVAVLAEDELRQTICG